MDTKYQKNIVLCWIVLLVAISDIVVSHGLVEGLQLLDKTKFGSKPKGTIKTIEVPEDNDLIDCVDIFNQPAFDNPRIKHLQMKPSPNLFPAFNNTNNLVEITQNWHKHGACPEGTVPILRTRNYNVTIHHRTPNDDLSTHEYAVAGVVPSIYHGGSAFLNVWNPQVSGRSELSLSQMWIASGIYSPNQREQNTIETGWMVNPSLYGDSTTRFFTFWTRDNYRTTHCYNYDCGGFMQTNRLYLLGSKINQMSVYGGRQYEIFVSINRDPSTGHWWLKLNHDILGYFPRELFTTLGNGAEHVEFGGEIVNLREGNHHTSTYMGSGHFPSEGISKACYIRTVKVVNHAYAEIEADLTHGVQVTNPRCYNLILGPSGPSLESLFLFGGRGYSPSCP